MELVEGGDLSEPIKRRRLVPETELRVWLRCLFVGLEHLHLSGVTHRDIKPENLLWDATANVAKITDFGVAGFFPDALGGDFMQSTQGSFVFFAPEMCRKMGGAGYSARAADLWACGVSLFMWLYHVPPYDADSIPDLLEKISSHEILYPADERSSPELLTLLHGLLERTPKLRLRCRELRRDAFLTEGGSDPLDASLIESDRIASASKADLVNAIKRVKLQLRAKDQEVDE